MGLMDKIWDEVFAGPEPSLTVAPGDVTHKMNAPMVDIPESPRPLERTESSTSPEPSPRSPATEGFGRRLSEGYESRSVRPSVSTKININGGGLRRVSLDTSRSLPTGYREILSTGSRKDENVWRSVFNPGAANRNMERIGASKFDKADPKAPSVYDWFYRPECRSQYR